MRKSGGERTEQEGQPPLSLSVCALNVSNLSTRRLCMAKAAVMGIVHSSSGSRKE